MQIYGLQFDSTSHLPFLTGGLTAKYINGAFAQSPVHYGKGVVWIDVTGADPLGAHWLDVEKGDATPARVPGWLHEKAQRLGQVGGIYCNESTLPAVLDAAGPAPMDLWLATLDGTLPEGLSLPPSVRLVAVQAFGEGLVGFHADCSLVVDRGYWEAHHA